MGDRDGMKDPVDEPRSRCAELVNAPQTSSQSEKPTPFPRSTDRRKAFPTSRFLGKHRSWARQKNHHLSEGVQRGSSRSLGSYQSRARESISVLQKNLTSGKREVERQKTIAYAFDDWLTLHPRHIRRRKRRPILTIWGPGLLARIVPVGDDFGLACKRPSQRSRRDLRSRSGGKWRQTTRSVGIPMSDSPFPRMRLLSRTGAAAKHAKSWQINAPTTFNPRCAKWRLTAQGVKPSSTRLAAAGLGKITPGFVPNFGITDEAWTTSPAGLGSVQNGEISPDTEESL